MSAKVKWLITLGGCVAAIAVFLITVLSRSREYVGTAVKLAATSGAAITIAMPAMVGDKVSLASLSDLLPAADGEAVQQLANEFAQPLIGGDREAARERFERRRKSAASDAEASAMRAMILVATHAEVDESARRAAADILQIAYPSDDVDNIGELRSCTAVAGALWGAADPDVAFAYSEPLLPHLEEQLHAHQSDGPVFAAHLLYAVHQSLPDDGGAAEETRRFITACLKRFPAGQMEARKGDVLLGGELASVLFAIGDLDAAVGYYDTLMDRLTSSATTSELAETLANRVAAAAKATAGETEKVEALEAVLLMSVGNVSEASLRPYWSDLRSLADRERVRRIYRRLVTLNSDATTAAAEMLLTSSPKSTPLDEVVADHLELISYEVEGGIQSAALPHLVSELQTRNAHRQADQIAEFIWQAFPTEPAGVQAFGVWAHNHQDPAGLARVDAAARELSASYPESPIAQNAQAAMAWVRVLRGQALEAILQVQHTRDGRTLGAQTILSLGLINQLMTEYQAHVEQFGYPVESGRLVMTVAEQLHEAGETNLAAALYWQVTRGANPSLLDPRTGLAFDPPALTGGDTVEAAATASLWRSLAILAMARQEEAVVELDHLVTTYPASSVTEVGRFLLAEQLAADGAAAQAWEHVQALSRDLLQTERGVTLYSQLAAAVPQEQQHQERLAKIASLREELLRNPNAADADRVLMQLGDLLRQATKHAEAVIHYEQVVRDHPQSRLCPEAVYHAITLYTGELADPRRAEELKQLMKTKYPTSRYAELLGV